MTNSLEPLSEFDLHAYADGQLAGEDLVRVEAYLKTHPEEAARVEEWIRQNAAIRDMFAPYAAKRAGDADLVKPKAESPARPRKSFWLTAASISVFALGNLTGLALPHFLGSPASAKPVYEQASEAYSIYTRDVRHPVEVWANDKDHLVSWLSKRLDKQLVAPDLKAQGLSLVGGRLVPVDGIPGALLMYEDNSGKRVTVLLGQAPKVQETAFLFASKGSLETLYWVDRSLSFAITGELDRNQLRAIAEECYKQYQG
jgi:anti-sigma factor RsiW